MLRNDCRVGMTVQMNASVDGKWRTEQWVITKVNPKNCKLRGVDTGRLLNAAPGYFNPAGTTAAVVESPIEDVPDFCLGETVKVKNPFPGFDADLVWVVIKVTHGGRTNVAVLGGDNNQYWRTHPRNLTPVKVTVSVRENTPV